LPPWRALVYFTLFRLHDRDPADEKTARRLAAVAAVYRAWPPFSPSRGRYTTLRSFGRVPPAGTERPADGRGRPLRKEHLMKTLTDEQIRELGDPLGDALNPRGEGEDFTWDCDHSHDNTIRILGDMGLTYEQIEAVVAELNDVGAHCDCEVMWNVVSRVEDEEDDPADWWKKE
jgi:hypothetical protein